jgi:hypothetical protein
MGVLIMQAILLEKFGGLDSLVYKEIPEHGRPWG